MSVTLILFLPFSGVISTFVSYVCKMATGRFGPSLGAVSDCFTGQTVPRSESRLFYGFILEDV